MFSLLPLLASLALAAPTPDQIFKRAVCYGGNDAANTTDVVSCANYLTALGNQKCCVGGPGDSAPMCKIGTAQVYGTNTGSSSNECTPCVDAARAVGFILDQCTWAADDTTVTQGTAYAYGDGFLQVNVTGLPPSYG